MALINSTEAAILAALVQGEKYGIAIIEHVRAASDGKLKLTLGGIYPTLYRMQEKGLLKSRWGAEHEVKGGARRRYYGATALGRRSLSDVIQSLGELAGVVQSATGTTPCPKCGSPRVRL